MGSKLLASAKVKPIKWCHVWDVTRSHYLGKAFESSTRSQQTNSWMKFGDAMDEHPELTGKSAVSLSGLQPVHGHLFTVRRCYRSFGAHEKQPGQAWMCDEGGYMVIYMTDGKGSQQSPRTMHIFS